MGAVENMAVILQAAEAFNNGDMQMLERLVAGNPRWLAGLGELHAAFPDGRLVLEELLADGDRVVERWSFSGTHQGEFLGYKPSGWRIRWTGISIYRLAERRIVERRAEVDRYGLLCQLAGADPAGVLLFSERSQTMTAQMIDPKAFLDAVDEQWNAHNLEGALSFFVEDAVVHLNPPSPDGGVLTGHAEIGPWIKGLFDQGFHVVSTQHRLAGNRLTWHAQAEWDDMRRMGVDPVEADGEILLDGGRIRRFSITFTPETVARMQSAMEQSSPA